MRNPIVKETKFHYYLPMEFPQEEALFEFLDNVTKPFTLDDISTYIQDITKKRDRKLIKEIGNYLEFRNAAFKQDKRTWISRRVFFEPVQFVITPTKLEIMNGILIPGHRCVPFANPAVMPNQYRFFWKKKPVPITTTEAPPDDLYPFYAIYGEEYAPQYIARENPKNENAFFSDPYEDPIEVSIQTLDMRGIYRMCKFIPGDRFIVQTLDWLNCIFSIERVKKDEWSLDDLEKWREAAENGFEESFARYGPGIKIEEQIVYAYWYGSKTMKELPAYSIEEFLFDKTNKIDIVPYGIETRFWYAGREIPDSKGLLPLNVPPDRRFIENLLFEVNIPISEYVILSYILDAFFRNENDISNVINRIIPPAVSIEEARWDLITEYVADYMEDFIKEYTLFTDSATGPVRQHAAEIHTAVIDLSAQLQKSSIDRSWLPSHTFIILSQIQCHTSAFLEDLAFPEAISEAELNAIDNSIECMVDTYTDLKEQIGIAMDNFRRSNLTVIHGGKNNGQLWRMIQISISGLDVWRRAIISHECTLGELNAVILTGMNWTYTADYSIYCETKDGGRNYLENNSRLDEIDFPGKKELVYEYEKKWLIKILIMSSYQPAKDETVRFLAGEGASPPKHLEGTRHYIRLLTALQTGSYSEKQAARRELGVDFVPEYFDIEKINRRLQK